MMIIIYIILLLLYVLLCALIIFYLFLKLLRAWRAQNTILGKVIVLAVGIIGCFLLFMIMTGQIKVRSRWEFNR